MIYFLGTEPHYRDHLAPVMNELTARGVELQAIEHTIDVPDDNTPLVSASCPESRHVARNRKIALVEHGVGQTYRHVDNCGYAGGKDREHISLFLCPNERTALLNAARYQSVPSVVVGCPKLDKWFMFPPGQDRPAPGEVTVAMSWHWDCNITHETRSAFRYYRDSIPQMTENYKVLGHAHPRMMDEVRPYYKRAGIEIVEGFDEVIERADIYCVDNSSTGFEWLAVTDKPLVWMNSPLYRETIDHGVRFWTWADAAMQVSHRQHWLNGILEAQVYADDIRDRRRACVEATYAFRDGRSASRAADEIEEWAA